MSILVTGGLGYIGSHTVVELLNKGYQVVIVDNLCNSSLEVLDKIHQIAEREPKFYNVDLKDRQGLEEVFINESIETVIHFAALKAVGESVKYPMEYYENNIVGTINLCNLMAKYECKKMVFSSSATVYGMNNQVPFIEEMARSATNPYGRTKIMIEDILKDLYKADSSWKIILLRYFNPIGAHESGLIGENPKGIPNNLMPYIMQVAIGKLQCLSIFGDNYNTIDGTGVRDYIHVMDLAEGHICALEYLKDHEGMETINLGTGKGYSVLEVVKTFEKVNHVRVNYKIAPRRAGDIAECYASTKKAKDVLGWEATRDLAQMCEDSWKYMCSKAEDLEERVN